MSFQRRDAICYHFQRTHTTPTRLKVHSKHAAWRIQTAPNRPKTVPGHFYNILNTFTKFCTILNSFVIWSVFYHHSQGTYTTPSGFELDSRHGASRMRMAPNHPKTWVSYSDNIFNTSTKFCTILNGFVICSAFCHYSQGTYTTPSRLPLDSTHTASRTKMAPNKAKIWVSHS